MSCLAGSYQVILLCYVMIQQGRPQQMLNRCASTCRILNFRAKKIQYKIMILKGFLLPLPPLLPPPFLPLFVATEDRSRFEPKRLTSPIELERVNSQSPSS